MVGGKDRRLVRQRGDPGLVARRLQQATGVAQSKGHEAFPVGVEFGQRYMVRAQNARIACALVGPNSLVHVYIALIWKDLGKVEVTTLDVAEMNHKNARRKLFNRPDHVACRFYTSPS